jgi:hypothetical protein
MSKGFPILTLAFAAAFAAVTPAHSQTLQVQVTANGATTNVGAGGSLSLAATAVGQAVFANVLVTNSGTAATNITGITLTGTPEITLTPIPLSRFSFFPRQSSQPPRRL